jgi:hypothetical protein
VTVTVASVVVGAEVEVVDAGKTGACAQEAT